MRLNDARKDPDAEMNALSFSEYLLRVQEGIALSDGGRIVKPRSLIFVSTETTNDTAKLLTDGVFREG